MNLKAAVEEAKALSNWLSGGLDGGTVAHGLRGQLAAIAFHVALEHHRGLIMLLDNGNPTSFMALLRPQVDACVRGAWLAYCATDDELEAFAENGTRPTESEIYRRVEAATGQGAIGQLKSDIWPMLCDFTHTGLLQLQRNLNGDVVEANYPDDELLQELGRSNACAMWTATVLAELQGNPELAAHMVERFRAMAAS